MNALPDRPRSRWRLAVKAGSLVVGGTFVLAVLWCLGFLWFVAVMPARVEDASTQTDAIVVLTGGSERLTTGIELLQQGVAKRLFISGVHRGVEVGDILKLVRSSRTDLADRIVLGYAAGDTVGNASETARWVADEGVASLRLVTGAYHMPRSLAEFRRVLPGVTIIPHPVFPDAVKSSEWWRWPGTATLLATEYSKYLAAEIRHWFMPRKPSP